MPTAIAQGKRFTFPEGTTEAQMGAAIDEYFSAQQADTASLDAFSPADFAETPATPADIAQQRPEQPSGLEQAGNVAMEAVSGFNRALFGIADFVGPDTVNAISELVGSKLRVPTFQESFGEERGAFAGEGLATDIAATAGELASAGGVAGAGFRAAGKLLPEASRLESALTGAARQLTRTAPGVEAAAGAASGVGQEVGREVGGEAGAVIGGIAAPLAGAAIATKLTPAVRQALDSPTIDQAVSSALPPKIKDVLSRRSRNLIDQESGLPEKAFQKAIEKQGMTFGSIVDDANTLPALRPGQSVDDYAKNIAIKRIKSGTNDPGLADKTVRPVRLGGPDEIVVDELASDAIKKGFGREYVGSAKNASPATKDAMVKMLTTRRKVMADSGLSERPLDVVGDEVFRRFKFVRGKANDLRKNLGVASKALKGKPLNTAPVEETVFDLLDGLNLNIPADVISDSTQLKAFLADDDVFKQTVISADNAAKGMIRKAVDLMSDASDDAFNGHILKKQLDTLIDYNRAESKLTPTGERFVRRIRGAVNESVRDVSPAYAEINDRLSDALTTMDNLTSVLPSKVRDNMFSTRIDKALGQEMRKLETNYSSRVALEDALDDLARTTESLGGSFNVDIRRLTNFNNALDDRFGPIVKGSLAGQQEIATKSAIRGAERPLELVKDIAAEKISKIIAPSDEQALNSMQRLLRRQQ